jgi:arylsulfatase A-like enzyme
LTFPSQGPSIGLVTSRILTLIAGAALAACGAQTPRPAVESRHVNVLLYSIDTLRADHVSTYGYHRDTTPTLDALASSGVIFTDTSAHSCKTAPSHMTIFTGLIPEAHGVVQPSSPSYRRLPEEIPTLATLLSNAGFRTGGITENGGVNAEMGFDQGMESYTHEVDLEATVAKTLTWLGEAANDPRPFFLFVHTYAVHDPYAPPEPWRSMFRADATAGSVDADMEWTGVDGWQESRDRFWNSVDRESSADLADLIDLYDGGIRWADDGLRRILQRLDQLNLQDDTIVVVLSDHGEEFLEHGMFLHAQLFEEILRVPLVMTFPERIGIEAQRIGDPVRLVDMTPTLLDLAGISPPTGMHGSSLVPLLRGGDGVEVEVLASWAEGHRWSIRQGSWKLIREGKSGGRQLSLFDLAADPRELEDLAISHAEMATKMDERMLQLQTDAAASLNAIAPRQPQDLSRPVRQRLEALGYIDRPTRTREHR